METNMPRLTGVTLFVLAACGGHAVAADDGYLGGRTLQGRVTATYVRAANAVFIDTRIAPGLRDRPAWLDVAARTDSGVRMDVLAEAPPGVRIAPGTRVETRIAHSPKTKMAVMQETNKIVEILEIVEAVASTTEPVLALRQPAGDPGHR